MKNFKKAPEIIIDSKSSGHVIDYKWNKKVMEKLLDPIEENSHLDKTLNTIGYKASMALTASLLEWVYWRYKGYSTLSEEILQRIEALWLSVENAQNTKLLVFDTELDMAITGFIKGPIWIALMNVSIIDALYKKGSTLLQSELAGLVLLVRHITPKKKTFDKWFDNITNKLAEQFPNQNTSAEYNEDAIYDSSSEPIVCRDFFFQPTFKYNKNDAEKAFHEFVSKIDFNTNSFCYPDKKFANI